ncbi:hypothetical protein [Saccharospirillum mangrovi]|uniref:hypothetical protein n=1 Tax=Saccharospirillum mangrovi TaxID=2161747 RepID=UPI000D33600E|nr:hypothetical protein [Saccharospirillum mangrovi]
MEPQTFFLVIAKSLVLLVLLMTLVRVLKAPQKPQRQPWWQQTSGKTTTTLKTPRLDVQFVSSQQLRFEWHDVAGASHYQLLERPGPNSVFQPVGSPVSAGREKRLVSKPLHSRLNTQYVLRAFNEHGFVDSSALCISERLMVKLNYLQKNNIDPTAYFGFSITQSAGGRTLIIAESDRKGSLHSAAYVFLRDSKGLWNKLAYMQGDDTDTMSSEMIANERMIEAPELAVVEIGSRRRRKKAGVVFNPNWQDAARDLRWLNFNSP